MSRVDEVSYRSDLSGGVGVLTRQTEVQHVALPVGGGKSTHRKVRLQEQTETETHQLTIANTSPRKDGTLYFLHLSDSYWLVCKLTFTVMESN